MPHMLTIQTAEQLDVRITWSADGSLKITGEEANNAVGQFIRGRLLQQRRCGRSRLGGPGLPAQGPRLQGQKQLGIRRHWLPKQGGTRRRSNCVDLPFFERQFADEDIQPGGFLIGLSRLEGQARRFVPELTKLCLHRLVEETQRLCPLCGVDLLFTARQ